MEGAVDKLSSTKEAVSTLFFPYIEERMKIMITISAEFMAVITGHSVTRSYLHKFKIIPNSTCPCGLKEEQTINHIILNCTQLENGEEYYKMPWSEQVTPGPLRLNNPQGTTSRHSRSLQDQ